VYDVKGLSTDTIQSIILKKLHGIAEAPWNLGDSGSFLIDRGEVTDAGMAWLATQA